MISTPILKLPHILKSKMPYITCDQLAYLLKNPKSSPYDNLILLDARSPFEFENCHIKTALNVIYPSQIKKILDDCSNKNACGICYCQLSQSRGPKLFQNVRSFDCEKNADHYPNLSLPQLFILNGGFSEFYKNYPSLCIGGRCETDNDTFSIKMN